MHTCYLLTGNWSWSPVFFLPSLLAGRSKTAFQNITVYPELQASTSCRQVEYASCMRQFVELRGREWKLSGVKLDVLCYSIARQSEKWRLSFQMNASKWPCKHLPASDQHPDQWGIPGIACAEGHVWTLHFLEMVWWIMQMNPVRYETWCWVAYNQTSHHSSHCHLVGLTAHWQQKLHCFSEPYTNSMVHKVKIASTDYHDAFLNDYV